MKKAALFLSVGLLAGVAFSACAQANTGDPSVGTRDNAQIGMPADGASGTKETEIVDPGPNKGITVGECYGKECDAPVSSDEPVVAPPPKDAPSDMEMVKAPAPIGGLDVVTTRSLPPQYILNVQYGLPNGCARPGDYEVARQDDVIKVAVSYYRPADPDVICTMIYGTAHQSINLGSDFASGKTYTVYVNDQKTEFKAL